jgi:hypothetical protein
MIRRGGVCPSCSTWDPRSTCSSIQEICKCSDVLTIPSLICYSHRLAMRSEPTLLRSAMERNSCATSSKQCKLKHSVFSPMSISDLLAWHSDAGEKCFRANESMFGV